VVKEALSRTGARIIPPVRAQRIIRDAAQRATELVASGDLAVPDVSPPFAMEVELRSPLSPDALRQIAAHEELSVVGDGTVAFTCDRMATAYTWAASVQILAAGRPLRDG
jgi:D-aminopeptidase